ncbi:MAG: ferrochelatase [Opitutales bacterium]|jgi:ferrochelatase
MRKAVLMVNLGSPEAPRTREVRRFLREFLSDPRVLNLPFLARHALLNLCILPLRPRRSAQAYSRIWTADGSPLISLSRRQQDGLQGRVDMPVHLAMRYGSPSIRAALETMRRDCTQRMLLMPMFPQYAMSSYETVVARVSELAAQIVPSIKIDLLQPFYAEPAYIDALVASAKPFLGDGFHRLLFSFHGLPERHVRKTDPSHAHCLCSRDCCRSDHPAHHTCYRHQCLRTAELFVRRACLDGNQCAISFQSRLGSKPWLTPYTSDALRRFGDEKIGTLLVMTPSFVTDCLESLDEISNEGRSIFQEAGGGEIQLIPCLNGHPLFLDFLASKVRQWQENVSELTV